MTAPAEELEEAVARKLCQIADLDPVGKYYPVHPSHRDIYWPMWQVFLDDAQEIITMVREAGSHA